MISNSSWIVRSQLTTPLKPEFPLKSSKVPTSKSQIIKCVQRPAHYWFCSDMFRNKLKTAYSYFCLFVCCVCQPPATAAQNTSASWPAPGEPVSTRRTVDFRALLLPEYSLSKSFWMIKMSKRCEIVHFLKMWNIAGILKQLLFSPTFGLFLI